MSLMQEFKAFVNRGNVIDLAVAVAVGGAFNALVDAVVKYGFMPIVDMILPKQLGWEKWKLGPILLGRILSAGVHFVVIAWVVFIVVTRFMRRRGATVGSAEPAPPPPEEVLLLREIRDSLRQR
jgi:large conductance mechanosensitive channel